MTGFPATPRVGHPVPLGTADRHLPAFCAHCGFWFRFVTQMIDRNPRHAGKAGIVCDDCWHDFIRGPIYRKHCGV